MQLLGGAALSLLVAGCSGVHASKSVSPIDFLIPGGGGLWRGLLYVPPPVSPPLPVPAVPADPAPEATAQLALVR